MFVLCLLGNLLPADALLLLGSVCADPAEGSGMERAGDGDGGMEGKQDMQSCAIASPEWQLK